MAENDNDKDTPADPPKKRFVVPRKGGVGGDKPSKNGGNPSKEKQQD